MFLSPISLLLLLALLALMSVFLARKQFIMILLSMEMATLALFLILILTLNPLIMSFYLLVMGAVEASLGLTLMVLMARLKGFDLLNLMNLK